VEARSSSPGGEILRRRPFSSLVARAARSSGLGVRVGPRIVDRPPWREAPFLGADRRLPGQPPPSGDGLKYYLSARRGPPLGGAIGWCVAACGPWVPSPSRASWVPQPGRDFLFFHGGFSCFFFLAYWTGITFRGELVVATDVDVSCSPFYAGRAARPVFSHRLPRTVPLKSGKEPCRMGVIWKDVVDGEAFLRRPARVVPPSGPASTVPPLFCDRPRVADDRLWTTDPALSPRARGGTFFFFFFPSSRASAWEPRWFFQSTVPQVPWRPPPSEFASCPSTSHPPLSLPFRADFFRLRHERRPFFPPSVRRALQPLCPLSVAIQRSVCGYCRLHVSHDAAVALGFPNNPPQTFLCSGLTEHFFSFPDHSLERCVCSVHAPAPSTGQSVFLPHRQRFYPRRAIRPVFRGAASSPPSFPLLGWRNNPSARRTEIGAPARPPAGRSLFFLAAQRPGRGAGSS